MKPSPIIPYILVLLGAGILTFGALSWRDTRSFIAKAEKAEDRGVEFMPQAGSDPAASPKGDVVIVPFQPDSPRNARLDNYFQLWGATLLSGITGAVFFLAGFGMFLVPLLKKRKDRYLRQNGTAIETHLQSVVLNTSVRVRGKSPWQIISQWVDPENGMKHVFKSAYIWYDPSLLIMTEKIRVFIRKNDPEAYVVDISFLPEHPPEDMEHPH
jgi:hypothetical protein